jgi:hypothetical protein
MFDSYADPKSIVRREKSAFDVPALGEFIRPWFRQHVELQKTVFAECTKLTRDAMERHASKSVALAKGFGNVVYSDLQGTKKSSATSKPWFETFTVAAKMIPEDGGSRFTLFRTGTRYETDAVACSVTDDHFDVTVHLPERLVERAGVADDAIRTTARALVGSAGFFALGARLWSSFGADDEYKISVAFPLHDGLAVGTLSKCDMDTTTPCIHLFSKSGVRRAPGGFSGLGSAPGIIRANGLRLGLNFVGMTYIDGSDMSATKERALRSMVALGRRHPVMPVLGLHVLFPYSRHLRETVRKLTPQVETAYADMVRLFDDGDVRKVFRLSGRPENVPPLPWHDDPNNARIALGRINLPVFPTVGQLADARADATSQILGYHLGR